MIRWRSRRSSSPDDGLTTLDAQEQWYRRLTLPGERSKRVFLLTTLQGDFLQKSVSGYLPLNHREIQRRKLWILPDEMHVLLSDAPREHGNRGVCHSVHNGPPSKTTTYAPNSPPAMVRREYSMFHLP